MTKFLKYDSERHRQSRNYLFFLIALLALIIMPGFICEIFPSRIFTARRIFAIFYVITIVAGVYTITYNQRKFKFGLVMGLMTLVLGLLRTEQNIEASWFYTLNFLISGSFFLFLIINCLREVIRREEVDLNTIYAAVCGYLLLGLGAMVFFNYINYMIPGAYSVEIPSDELFPMLYFSFVTMTTLGYGDISPMHPISRSLAMFFAVVGQLYLTVLIAMLVGKYISQSTHGKE